MDYNPKTPDEFSAWRHELITLQGQESDLLKSDLKHHLELGVAGRFHMNEFAGFPILQKGDDLLQLQNIFWDYNPSVVIECGVARGGSVVFHAYNLALSYFLGRTKTAPRVFGIDVLIHGYNRTAICNSPLGQYITLIEKSSTDETILTDLETHCSDLRAQPKVIILDSNHTEEHVLQELELYSSICVSGDYIIVFDTIVEPLSEISPESYANRPWGFGSNPLTAVNKFLQHRPDFYRLDDIDNKLLASGAIMGWLRKA